MSGSTHDSETDKPGVGCEAGFCGPVPRGDSILATINGKPMPIICERDADGIVVAKSADLESVHRISRGTWWKFKRLQAEAGRGAEVE